MSLLLGAADLGLVTKWRFGFVGYGRSAITTPGVVYLDVGGRLDAGVIDHHSATGTATGTADLVLHHPALIYNHLLAPWLARFEAGQIPAGTEWTPTIITHFDPDWDAVVAAFLTMELIEHGETPRHAGPLASYTTLVDQGQYGIDLEAPATLRAPHLGYLGVQNLRDNAGRPLSSEGQLRRGLALIHHVLNDVESARRDLGLGAIRTSADLMPPSPGTTQWARHPDFADIAALLDRESEAFKEDDRHARHLERVPLPATDGGAPLEVRTWVASRPTKSIMNKYWARARGYPFTIIPLAPTDALSERYPKVILALDPAFSVSGRRPDLQGLGYSLEREETRLRLGEMGHDDRGGAPRFPDGYCTNADPWYDGRGHVFTIVDAPNDGTKLSYAKIVEIATEAPFWKIPLSRASVTMVWMDEGDPKGGAPIGPFRGMAPTLEAYAAQTLQTVPQAVAGSAPPGCRASVSWRSLPQGTCQMMRIVQIDCDENASLDDLVGLRERLSLGDGAQPPDYLAARVTLGRSFANPQLIGALLRRLAAGDVREVPLGDSRKELLLFNNRTLIFQGEPTPSEARDPDVEALLYTAFLNESLIRFSQRTSRLLRNDHVPDAADAASLRQDVLRFHTLYYQIEVSRIARGRFLFGELAKSLELPVHLSEVQGQLDRLAEIEARAEAEKLQASNEAIGDILFIVGVLGVLQTVVALWTLSPETWTPRFTSAVALVFLVAAYPTRRWIQRWREARKNRSGR